MDQPDKPRGNPARLDDERLKGPVSRPDVEDVVTEGAPPDPRSKCHDAGSDANDTADGLTESEEAVRHAAEDIPVGQDPEGSPDSVPVFERGSLPPKV